MEREAAAGGMLPVAHLAGVRVEREEEAAAGGILLRAALWQQGPRDGGVARPLGGLDVVVTVRALP